MREPPEVRGVNLHHPNASSPSEKKEEYEPPLETFKRLTKRAEENRHNWTSVGHSSGGIGVYRA